MSDSEEHSDASGEYEGSQSSAGEEEEVEMATTDGFANVIQKILNQDVGNKNPVLAKRKTQIMKDQEAHQQEQHVQKKRRIQNRANREKQMVEPGVDTIDYERQLRKVATRGVIALFNAIFQAKKETEVEHDGTKSVARSNKDTDCTVPDVRQMTQEKFLELLKSGSGPSDGAGARSTVQNGRSGDKTGTSRGKGAQATDEVAENSGRWDAINDDYMIGKKVSLKNWDKEEDGDDDNNSNSDDDYFEEILDEADQKSSQSRNLPLKKQAADTRSSGAKTSKSGRR